MKKTAALLFGAIVLLVSCTTAQPLSQKKSFTRQDTLRGSVTPERAWWDVQHYRIAVEPDITARTIKGTVVLTFDKISNTSVSRMQIDLQEPMVLDSAIFAGKGSKNIILPFTREGNVYFIETGSVRDQLAKGNTLHLRFHGKPRAAQRPPWDGGWIWQKDAKERPWISVACQGLGASVWFPCKDHQGDEPDKGSILSVVVPDSLVAVANGKLLDKSEGRGKAWYTWEVRNPINNYNIIPYIGKYVNFTETYAGEKGPLNCSYWVLDYNLEKAKKQFTQAGMTLKALEHWFGPFPWYEDDFKLVEAPHLGMEHQSAVAYGNRYLNGYLGTDLSGSGIGTKFDFIIVHESGHEWFGNNITSKDVADMWVHEGFTSYSETLFAEYHFGKEAADKYVQGIRKNIANDMPVIGRYGVNQEGSGDMYYKGANMLHTIRQVINDDEKFRSILRGLNRDFYHQTVTTGQVEDYISRKSGIDFSKVFDQYLRDTRIPVLELKAEEDKMKFRWTNCVDGFNMPVKLTNGQWIRPATSETKVKVEGSDFSKVTVDPNFYVHVKR